MLLMDITALEAFINLLGLTFNIFFGEGQGVGEGLLEDLLLIKAVY